MNGKQFFVIACLATTNVMTGRVAVDLGAKEMAAHKSKALTEAVWAEGVSSVFSKCRHEFNNNGSSISSIQTAVGAVGIVIGSTVGMLQASNNLKLYSGDRKQVLRHHLSWQPSFGLPYTKGPKF